MPKTKETIFPSRNFFLDTALLDWRIASITVILAACFTGFLLPKYKEAMPDNPLTSRINPFTFKDSSTMPKVNVSPKAALTTLNNRADSRIPTTNPKGMLTTPKRKASKYTLRRFCPFVAPILDSIPICLIRSCKEMERALLIIEADAAIKRQTTMTTKAISFAAPLPPVIP